MRGFRGHERLALAFADLVHPVIGQEGEKAALEGKTGGPKPNRDGRSMRFRSCGAQLPELLETLGPTPLVLVAGLVLGKSGMSEREARSVGRFRFELDGDQRLGVAAFPAPGV